MNFCIWARNKTAIDSAGFPRKLLPVASVLSIKWPQIKVGWSIQNGEIRTKSMKRQIILYYVKVNYHTFFSRTCKPVNIEWLVIHRTVLIWHPITFFFPQIKYKLRVREFTITEDTVNACKAFWSYFNRSEKSVSKITSTHANMCWLSLWILSKVINSILIINRYLFFVKSNSFPK